MKKAWNAVKRFGWAAFSAAVAVCDFVAGIATGRWYDFALAAWMVACAAVSLYFARTRKATPVASTPNIGNTRINIGTTTGPLHFAPAGTPAPTQKPQPPKPTDFTGLPFDLAIGEVYGLRMWRMDPYGRLRARNWTHAEPWRPGVNVAKCVPTSDNDVYTAWARATGMPIEKPTPKPPHDTPSESCACGFYAYTDPRHADTVSYKEGGVGPILGIIKGTGRTLMGTRGFRCEKAEIVAFRDPTRGGTKDDPWRKQQLANLQRVYPDVPILESREALLEFAPLTNTLPDPSTDEFWALP